MLSSRKGGMADRQDAHDAGRPSPILDDPRSLALAAVAHDVNQMLAVISGRVGLLLRRDPDPDRRCHLQAIELACRDAATVLARLRPGTEPRAGSGLPAGRGNGRGGGLDPAAGSPGLGPAGFDHTDRSPLDVRRRHRAGSGCPGAGAGGPRSPVQSRAQRPGGHAPGRDHHRRRQADGRARLRARDRRRPRLGAHGRSHPRRAVRLAGVRDGASAWRVAANSWPCTGGP